MRRKGRRPDTNTSLNGADYVNEMLKGNETHSQEILRMEKDVFLNLCNQFQAKGRLHDSRYISVEENMTIFIMTISHNTRHRMLK